MEDSTRKVIIGVIIFFTILICGLLIFTDYQEKNKKEEENSIKDITFRGLSLEEHYTADSHVIFDSKYEYLHGQVGISTDKNGIIYYLCFFTTYDAKGNKTNNISNAKIRYKDNLLTTYEDFVEFFDDGDVSINDENNSKTVEYRDDDVYLTLYIKNEELINVELEKLD